MGVDENIILNCNRRHILILWTGSCGLRYVKVTGFCGYGSEYKYLVLHELNL